MLDDPQFSSTKTAEESFIVSVSLVEWHIKMKESKAGGKGFQMFLDLQLHWR